MPVYNYWSHCLVCVCECLFCLLFWLFCTKIFQFNFHFGCWSTLNKPQKPVVNWFVSRLLPLVKTRAFHLLAPHQIVRFVLFILRELIFNSPGAMLHSVSFMLIAAYKLFWFPYSCIIIECLSRCCKQITSRHWGFTRLQADFDVFDVRFNVSSLTWLWYKV